MNSVKEAIKWVKYYLIVMQGLATGKTVVNFFGTSYIISGNVVKKFGG